MRWFSCVGLVRLQLEYSAHCCLLSQEEHWPNREKTRKSRGGKKEKGGKNKKDHSFKDFLESLKQLLGFNLQKKYVVRKDLAMYDEWSSSGCLVNDIRIERHLMIILHNTSLITCGLGAAWSGIDLCTFCT